MNANLELGSSLAQLEALGKRAEDKQGLAEALSTTLLQLIRNGFDTGKSPAGATWLPLKIRKGGDPLVDTGALRDSIKANVVAGGAEIDLTTDKIQANLQQFGGTVRPKNANGYLVFMGSGGHPIFAKEVYVPARPYMPDGYFSDSWASAIDKSIENYFDVSAK
jgi:phage gpG-like protein